MSFSDISKRTNGYRIVCRLKNDNGNTDRF